MFFRKKKKEKSELRVPVEKVKELSKKGMSDKDIIRQLKSEGYSYEEIEQAMLQAVKESTIETNESGIETKPAPSTQIENIPQPQVVQQPQLQQTQPRVEDFEIKQPTPEEETPSFVEEEEISPEVIIEELVESIVDEKWSEIKDRFQRLEDEIKTLKHKLKEEKEVEIKDYDSDIEALYSQIEELEARVGGLERAFKQFLPTLTKNIEELQKMVEELKS